MTLKRKHWHVCQQFLLLCSLLTSAKKKCLSFIIIAHETMMRKLSGKKYANFMCTKYQLWISFHFMCSTYGLGRKYLRKECIVQLKYFSIVTFYECFLHFFVSSPLSSYKANHFWSVKQQNWKKKLITSTKYRNNFTLVFQTPQSDAAINKFVKTADEAATATDTMIVFFPSIGKIRRLN